VIAGGRLSETATATWTASAADETLYFTVNFRDCPPALTAVEVHAF
jgi:hypothetical protein